MSQRLSLVLIAIVSQILAAQAAVAQRWPVGLEATYGLGFGIGEGEYVESKPTPQLAFDLSAVGALKSRENGALILTLSTGFQTIGPHSAVCRLKPGSERECVPHFPSFLIVAAAAGWENRRKSLRFSGGLGLVSDGDFAETLALQLRMDGARQIFRHVALAYSARSLLVPDHQGELVELIGFGVGLRIR